jgi:hypothetical protein
VMRVDETAVSVSAGCAPFIPDCLTSAFNCIVGAVKYRYASLNELDKF